MDDVELRRFINNLIDHTEGRQVDLPTRIDQMVWNDVVELLNHNETKRQRTIEKRKEAGKKGGAPVGNNNAQKKTDVDETTKNNQNNQNNQMVEKQPKQPVICNMIYDEGNMIYDICNMKKEEGYMLKEEGNMLNDIMKQEFDILQNKKQETGWNSLSVKEAGRYYQLKEQLNIK